jgi:hypothetical protein
MAYLIANPGMTTVVGNGSKAFVSDAKVNPVQRSPITAQN